jgi:cytosine/adenosine deaminase-related metal-dependent hydrolase
LDLDTTKAHIAGHLAGAAKKSLREPRLLRARLVLPLSKPAIPNGAVLISGRRIIDVKSWRHFAPELREDALDLGEMVVLPGLVNAHCHLDYTDMAGQFAPPRHFTDWLKLLTTAKAQWKLADYAESWGNGAAMLVRTGTTTVGDIEAVPQLLPEVWKATPLRVFSFLEMIGLTTRRQPAAILQEAVEKITSLKSTRTWLGLSPHAPYTTLAELLRLNADTARRQRWRLCTHVAESALEFEMFVHGRGEMFEWLKRSGRDVSDCGLGSPVRHLERCGILGPNLLAVHANYLARGDALLLGERKVNVAHCPRSHAYFKHAPFPLARLARAGANICLGTDSLASVNTLRRHPPELSMFEEMRTLANREPRLSPKAILQMATLNGARALGLNQKAGELSKSSFADLIAVPYSGKPGGVWDAIVHHHGNVSASMINGKWAIPPVKVASLL